MDYFISREGQSYGPYSLADLQRYAASGEVSLSDLATSDALTEPVPVSQIIGTIAAPAASSAGGPVSLTGDVYPDPPNLNWGLLLLFCIISCGVFTPVWELVQAAWLKRVEPQSKALFFYAAAAVAFALIIVASAIATANHSPTGYASLCQLIYYVISLTARFSFRNSIEQHFNSAEPMGLSLSGVMTFFFGGIYFQYHINDIVRRKTADRMYAASL